MKPKRATKEKQARDSDSSDDDEENDGAKKKKKKKPRAKKAWSEDMPKRPTAAFFHFLADKREEIKKDLGDKAKGTEVTKQAGVMWKVFTNQIQRRKPHTTTHKQNKTTLANTRKQKHNKHTTKQHTNKTHN